MNQKYAGFFLGATGAATYGLIGLFTMPLYSAGLSPDSVLFYRFLTAAASIAVLMTIKHQSFRLKKQEVLPLVTCGMLNVGTSLTAFESFLYMDYGIAMTIQFCYPVIVALIMALFFKEKPSLKMVCCIGLAFIGIALLCEIKSAANVTGIILSFLSAFFLALYLVVIQQSTLKETPGILQTFYVLLICLAFYTLKLKFGLNLQIISSVGELVNAAALGILATAISVLCVTLAIKYAGATQTAVLGALEPLTAVLVGMTAFDEQLTLRLSVGIVLIIVSVALVITAKRETN